MSISVILFGWKAVVNGVAGSMVKGVYVPPKYNTGGKRPPHHRIGMDDSLDTMIDPALTEKELHNKKRFYLMKVFCSRN